MKKRLDRMVHALLWWLILVVGCDTRLNPKYCDETTLPDESCICDLVKHECTGVHADLAVPIDVDLEAPDLGDAPDLTEIPDLSEPDLTPPPDLVEIPDLTPPVPYFWPDVQGILNTVGCAKSGCHNASDGLYQPFLIPNPSPGPAVHQNYTNFVAEASATVLGKLLNNNGTSHGGVTKNSADRKPCSTLTAEPCATLQRWYDAGAMEIAP